MSSTPPPMNAAAPAPPMNAAAPAPPMNAAAPAPPAMRLKTWHCLLLLAALRIGIHAVLAHTGLSALSDDDYSRTVIAERFAEHPAFDPSGTSWLPLPFWVSGGAMMLFGRSLRVVRAVTDLWAVGAGWLLFAGMRRLRIDRGAALLGAVLATLVPPSAVLGSVSVPELPAAALSAFALLSITRPHLRAMAAESPDWETGLWLSAASVAAATLCRYEAWPIAAVIAAFAWIRRVPLATRIGASALAVAGPAAWMADNRIVHGDALHFLHRVSSYRAALGAPSGLSEAAAYVQAVVTGCPSLLVPLVVVGVAAWRVKPTALLRWGPALGGVGAMVAFLVAGAAAGAAPTHHPERALLLLWILGCAAVVDLGGALVRDAPARGRRGLRVAEVVVLALLALDMHRQLAGTGVDRKDEEAVGRALRALVAPGQRVLIATEDYGYFAVIAAFGRPGDTAIDQTHDPRAGRTDSSLSSADALVARLAAERASWLVAPASALLPGLLMARATANATLAVYAVGTTPAPPIAL
jgi:Dolichyl-phosphate-mannose-protein mannosyltransferase